MTSRPIRILALAALLGWLLVGAVHLHAPDAPRSAAECVLCGSPGHAAAVDSVPPVLPPGLRSTPLESPASTQLFAGPDFVQPAIRAPPHISSV